MSLPVVIRITTFLLLTLGPVVANGEPAFEIVPDSKAFGCSQIYPFKEDNLKIVLRDGNKILAEQFFCSSYGLADATIEKDAKGHYFLLLRYGEGRGTNARSEFLNVYKVS